jgi:hypothetical protein
MNASSKISRAVMVAVCLGGSLCGYAQTAAVAGKPLKPLSPVDRFDYIASTQTMGNYRQPAATVALGLPGEAAEVQATGTDVIKITLGPTYAKHGYVAKLDPAITSLAQLAQSPAYKQVFDMPFAHYLMWTAAFSTYNHVTPFHGHLSNEVLAKEYQEIYDLTKYFLTTYNGTGKTFYLGNWEGDWILLSGAAPMKDKWEEDVNPDAPQGMIDWLTARQRAIDDAKKATPHHDVQVYFYVECNLVQKSVKEGKPSVAKSVLPAVNPDFVSYSSYDSTNPDKNLHHDLPAALDYMQAQLKPKPGLPEKRVFVGEYTSLAKNQTPEQQDARMRDIIATGIKWGTPFVLYWELYNNVFDDDGTPQGCWLIDTNNVKQPVYFTYQNFNKDARAYVAAAFKKTGSVPTKADFQAFAYKWFSTPVKAAEAPQGKGQ